MLIRPNLESQPFNLREALLVLEVSSKDRDSPDFDWGYAGAFGKSHRLDDQRGNPVANSEVHHDELLLNG